MSIQSPRRSILAVWHWPRRMWVAIAIAGVIYPFTCAPVVYCMYRMGASNDDVQIVFKTIYAPLFIVSAVVPPIGDLVEAELQWMVATFGGPSKS